MGVHKIELWLNNRAKLITYREEEGNVEILFINATDRLNLTIDELKVATGKLNDALEKKSASNVQPVTETACH
ncbi:MAG: hypothetical protein H7282_04825 [Cytophagaceae bacterium]|nr:hypothetical protein [Cytophagaceae bacterium]